MFELVVYVVVGLVGIGLGALGYLTLHYLLGLLFELPRVLIAPWKKITRSRYRHVRRGSTYILVGSGLAQCAEPIADGEFLAIYRCEETGNWWVRPMDEFEDGRFEYKGEA